ncbi:MAG TPA: hypothetical protein VN253_15220 [Kofleriaceae bacterium]|nr:hypothetical protein [Kofleriaceae bacterium]
MSIICEAIRTRTLLEFDYHGLPRVVAPYCHGVSHRGVELLRAVQVRGGSSSGSLGLGKLWRVSELRGLHISGEPFAPDDPHYNPDDRAMREIHCRI